MKTQSLQLELILLFILSTVTFASIRVVSYNMQAGSGAYTTDHLLHKVAVLKAIGDYPYNGISRPFDILVAQELMCNKLVEQHLINGYGSIDGLNDYYGPGVYAYDTGAVGGDGWNCNGMIYNTQTVQLIERVNFRAPTAPRDTVRYRFRILGYGPESDIYIYNTHMKAFGDSESRTRRTREARHMRWHIGVGGDALPEGTHIIYAGDFNLTGGGTEDAVMSNGDVSALGGYDNPWYYLVMQEQFAGTGPQYLSTGHGRAVDPSGITQPINWNGVAAHRRLHTWNQIVPTSRLDFQLVSTSLYDGQGVSLIGPGIGNSIATESSYRALGNDGTHIYGRRISDSTSGRYDSGIYHHFAAASDHLPVIADYQRPAMMEVSVVMPYEPIAVNEPAMAVLTVMNSAQVTAPVGADELNYWIEVLDGGTLIGNASGVDYALSGGQTHIVELDTVEAGEQMLSIRVTSNSPGCANPVYGNSFSYSVGNNSGCGLFDFIDSWLSSPLDDHWNPQCDLSISFPDKIGLPDFAVFSQFWNTNP